MVNIANVTTLRALLVKMASYAQVCNYVTMCYQIMTFN